MRSGMAARIAAAAGRTARGLRCPVANPKKQPGTPTPPRRGHQRTRDDHASETAEDYVEAIAEIVERLGQCRVKDLADRFGVSHVTVVRTVSRLAEGGLVTTEPYKPIELTPKGTRLARACRERHEVVYRFLLAIGVPEKVAAVDSEGLEHHVSKATLARFKAIAEGAGGRRQAARDGGGGGGGGGQP